MTNKIVMISKNAPPPPSSAETVSKRLNMSEDQSKENDMKAEESSPSDEGMMPDTSDTDNFFSENDTDATQDLDLNCKIEVKLNHMERRITKAVTNSIKKLIEKALQPLKDDVKKLGVSSNKQEKKLEYFSKLQKENEELRIIVSEVKH